MFAKRLLNIISTLFIGSHLVYLVKGAAFGNCSSLTNYGNIDQVITSCTNDSALHYCLDGSKIYGFKDNAAVCEINTAGIYVLHEDQILGASQDVTVANYVKMYQCSGITSITCKPTYGFVLNNNQYLEINASGTNGDPKAIGGLTDKSTGDACNPGELYDVDDGSVKLCLSSTVYSDVISSATVKKYVMNNVQENVFTAVASDGEDKNKPIIIQVGDNKIVLANSGYDYCAKTGAEVSETFKEFCSDDNAGHTPCDGNPYECEANGICERANPEPETCDVKASGSNCGNGYYIVNPTADGETGVYTKIDADEGSGTLFKCTDGSCVEASADYGTSGVGYYVNKNVDYDGEAPYIKCAAGGVANCYAVRISDECDAVGKIIDESGLKLCLDVGVSSGVLGTATGNHFISVDSINVFAASAKSEKYAKVNFGADGSVHLATADSVKYEYTDDTYKIYTKSNAQTVDTGLCNISDAIVVEFKKDGDNAEYVKKAEDQRPHKD